MRAVVPDELFAERRRLGLDRRDETWDEMLNVVPLASAPHNVIGADLARTLGRVALAGGAQAVQRALCVRSRDRDMTGCRVSDLGFARPDDATDRGIAGRAVLVVEAHSPKDESCEKRPFDHHVGVEELLSVDPGVFEMRRPDGDGWTPLESLGVALSTDGGRQQVHADLGFEEV